EQGVQVIRHRSILDALSAFPNAPSAFGMTRLALLAVASVVPALLPQESKHRRDVWRDWLRHRERMARLRHKAVNPEPVTAKERKDHPNIPADRAA
ncbi:hypothetical protein ACFC0E_18600, partial [Streptomyces sp. NPDC056190]